MKLSFARSDVERFFGFQSKKFTMVNYVFTFFIGVVLTLLVYGALLPFREQGIDYVDMFFHGGAKNRSTLPYYTVFLTCWSLAILLIKSLKLRAQRKAFEVKILPEDPNFVLSPRTAQEILDRIRLQVDEPRSFILFNRIDLALGNLQNLGSVSAVSECLNTQSGNDEEYLSSSYTVLNGFIWAIPVLGFIGTVLGLSSAVGGFGSVVAQEGTTLDQMKSALGGVTGGLGVAFETTLIALVLALIVQLITKFVQNREKLFLDACADYCNRNIIAKMKHVNLVDDRSE